MIKGSKGINNSKFHFKVNGRYRSIDINDVKMIVSETGYAKIYTISQSQPFMVCKTLIKLQDIFTPDNFLRCHNSILVNKSLIDSFDSKTKIIIVDMQIIPVSRRNATSIFITLSENGILDRKINASKTNFNQQ